MRESFLDAKRTIYLITFPRQGSNVRPRIGRPSNIRRPILASSVLDSNKLAATRYPLPNTHLPNTKISDYPKYQNVTLTKLSADPSGVEHVGLKQAGRYPIPKTKTSEYQYPIPNIHHPITYTPYPTPNTHTHVSLAISLRPEPWPWPRAMA